MHRAHVTWHAPAIYAFSVLEGNYYSVGQKCGLLIAMSTLWESVTVSWKWWFAIFFFLWGPSTVGCFHMKSQSAGPTHATIFRGNRRAPRSLAICVQLAERAVWDLREAFSGQFWGNGLWMERKWNGEEMGNFVAEGLYAGTRCTPEVLRLFQKTLNHFWSAWNFNDHQGGIPQLECTWCSAPDPSRRLARSPPKWRSPGSLSQPLADPEGQRARALGRGQISKRYRNFWKLIGFRFLTV